VLSPQLRIEVLPQHTALVVQARHEALSHSAFPSQPNTTAGSDPLIWWMGPEAWLITSTTIDGPTLAKSFPLASVEISDSYATFQVRGAHARDLLARGCGLNLDPENFRAGQCARTRLASLSALLRPLSDQSLEIWIDRSAAHYFYDWLMDIAAGMRD
jgi:sarcosine oxidase subunit gamma